MATRCLYILKDSVEILRAPLRFVRRCRQFRRKITSKSELLSETRLPRGERKILNTPTKNIVKVQSRLNRAYTIEHNTAYVSPPSDLTNQLSVL